MRILRMKKRRKTSIRISHEENARYTCDIHMNACEFHAIIMRNHLRMIFMRKVWYNWYDAFLHSYSMIFAKKSSVLEKFFRYWAMIGWILSYIIPKKERYLINLKKSCISDTRSAKISSYEWIFKSTTNPQQKESSFLIFFIGKLDFFGHLLLQCLPSFWRLLQLQEKSLKFIWSLPFQKIFKFCQGIFAIS